MTGSSFCLSADAFNLALLFYQPESSLNQAFATSDLGLMCRAVDAALLHSGCIIEIARAAECDRTTLYRAFRRERGPQLDTMTRVLRALGLQLIVVSRSEMAIGLANGAAMERRRLSRKERHAAASARRFTAALKAGRLGTLLEIFTDALRTQESVAAFAKKTMMSRENLYRVFSRNPNPRFGTLVNVLSALDLQFAVRPLSRRAELEPVAKGVLTHSAAAFALP